MENSNISNDEMLEKIIKIIESYDCSYEGDVTDNTTLKKIYDLFCHHVIFEPLNPVEIDYLGWYYQFIKKDYDLMKKYYLINIEDNDNAISANSLAYYYESINDHEAAKNYYLFAIDRGYVIAMNNLAHYYRYREHNPSLMKKYYLMAIEKNDTMAMCNLAHHYRYNKLDTEKMSQYYLMAVEKGCHRAMFELGSYYDVQWSVIKSDEAKFLCEKYYLMAVDKENTDAMCNLAEFYKKNKDTTNRYEKYYLMAIKNGELCGIDELVSYYTNKYNHDITMNDYFLEFINLDNIQERLPPIFKFFKNVYSQKIDLMKLHFDYSENGLGFEEAKKDFNCLLSKN